jgi:hypothetical protein
VAIGCAEAARVVDRKAISVLRVNTIGSDWVRASLIYIAIYSYL